MEHPPSPCTGVCRIGETTGLCLGCRRNLNEIAAWSRLSPQEKQAVLARLPQRSAR